MKGPSKTTCRRILATVLLVAAVLGGVYWVLGNRTDEKRRGEGAASVASPAIATIQATQDPSPVPVAPSPVAPDKIATDENAPSNYRPPAPNTTSRGTSVYTVVDSKNKVHTAFKESDDIRVVGLVGRNKAIVEVSEKGKAALEANPRLTFEGIPGKTFNDVKLRAGELTVTPVRTEDLAIIERVVAENGGKVEGRCGVEENPDLRIVATDETIAALMELPEARWIENYEIPQFFNYNTARALNVNDCWPASAGDDCGAAGLGLTGDGQLVTTCDSGVDTGNRDTLHPALKPNVIGLAVVFPRECTAYDKHKHGTHTAGSIVGTGAMSSTVLKDSSTQTYYVEGDLRGMAYGAKLWAWMGGAASGSGSFMPDSLDQMFRPTKQESYATYCAEHGIEASIFSCSLGAIGGGKYGGQSANIDKFCWEHPDFLPCFAAGNYSGQLTYPGVAKNTLTVGGATDTGTAGTQGLTSDGRIYPNIISAWSVTSCNTSGTGVPLVEGDSYYRGEAGTSMSTPITAGVCALVREWLVKYRGFNETDKRPSSALIKAILFGGAIKLTTTDPETGKTTNVDASKQGAGRTNLKSSIAPEDGRSVYIADRIQFGEGCKTIFTFKIDSPLDIYRSFEAQLAWVDYPGTTDSDQTAPKLVNDLDLELYLPNGDCIYGRGDDGDYKLPDRLNNAEKIHMSLMPSGTYKLVVNCANVPHSSLEGGAAALYMKGLFDPDAVEVKRIAPPMLKILVR